jgi:hypothetical protein
VKRASQETIASAVAESRPGSSNGEVI